MAKTTDFGTDTSCTRSLRTGRLVTGARLVGEAAFRRLITPRGTLFGGEDEANYGEDLSRFVGTEQTESDAAALPGIIRTELLKDERIAEVDVQVTRTLRGPLVTYDVMIKATTDEGPFTLKLGVTAVSVELLGLTTEED